MSGLNQDAAHEAGSIITVKTYAGPEIKCRVDQVRRLKSGVAYDVTPIEDKTQELKRAGVPVKDPKEKFVAFDFQVKEEPKVVSKLSQPVGEPLTRVSPVVVRRKAQPSDDCLSQR